MLSTSLLSGLMVGAGRDHHPMRSLFRLSDRHRSTALEGQRRNRKPQKKAEKRTHDRYMVPQIKRMHQDQDSRARRSARRSVVNKHCAWD